MKRRLLTIAVFLLLGAVVNVAVAWGCALEVDVFDADLKEGFVRIPKQPLFHVVRRSRVGATRVWVRGQILEPWEPQTLADVLQQFDSSAFDSSSIFRVVSTRIVDRRGWPALSMWSETRSDFVVPGRIMGGINTGLSRRYAGYVLPRILPIRPLSFGFLLNTLFYATILWLLIPGPFALRRFLRLRRGLCPKCAYPMGESAVCTECGIALPQHTARMLGAGSCRGGAARS